MTVPKVLIADDDRSVRRVIRRTLEAEDIETVEACTAEETLNEIFSGFYDLVIIDINFGNTIDGYDVVHEIRKKDIRVPIFLISGLGEDHDKILGYGIGADAYITKPFSPAVLSAMVKSQLKKSQRNPSANFLDMPPFRFDRVHYTVYKNDAAIPLSSKETKLMLFFMENKGKVFTKEQLYENIWNDPVVSDNTIMVFISKLRRKIEDDPNNPVFLKTVWGVGYVFSTQ